MSNERTIHSSHVYIVRLYKNIYIYIFTIIKSPEEPGLVHHLLYRQQGKGKKCRNITGHSHRHHRPPDFLVPLFIYHEFIGDVDHLCPNDSY